MHVAAGQAQDEVEVDALRPVGTARDLTALALRAAAPRSEGAPAPHTANEERGGGRRGWAGEVRVFFGEAELVSSSRTAKTWPW